MLYCCSLSAAPVLDGVDSGLLVAFERLVAGERGDFGDVGLSETAWQIPLACSKMLLVTVLAVWLAIVFDQQRRIKALVAHDAGETVLWYGFEAGPMTCSAKYTEVLQRAHFGAAGTANRGMVV